MLEVRVFEAFAGIGAQTEAMKNLMSNNELLKKLGIDSEKVKFKNVGTSEFFIDAIISYDALHHGSQVTFPKYEKLSKKVMLKFLLKYTLSKDSKNPCTREEIIKLPFEKIRQIYIALIRNKNYGSIVDIKPEDFDEKIAEELLRIKIIKEKEFITMDELEEIFGLKKDKVLELRTNKELKYFQMGDKEKVLFKIEDVRKFMNKYTK